MMAAVWRRRFSSRGQAVNARCQHRLHRGGDLEAVRRTWPGDMPRRPDQHAGLHQRVHTFLQKRIALGARNQERCEGRQAGVVPQQRLEHLTRVRRGQRVESQLRSSRS